MIPVLQQGAATHQVRGFDVFWCSVSSSTSLLDVLLIFAATGQMFAMVQLFTQLFIMMIHSHG